MSKFKKASSIKDLRAYYGMTQQELADYLQVSRALLSLAELGQRELTGEARKKWDRLYGAMAAPAEPNLGKALKSVEENQTNTAVSEAKHRLHINQHKLMGAERALAKMQFAHNRATRILASLEALRDSATRGEISLFGVLAAEAAVLYNTAGENAQLKLELRIESIKAETSFLKRKFKDML
jgi:transcriptional regulator with XRE-family HTH domain